jgi:hypothetical protein
MKLRSRSATDELLNLEVAASRSFATMPATEGPRLASKLGRNAGSLTKSADSFPIYRVRA